MGTQPVATNADHDLDDEEIHALNNKRLDDLLEYGRKARLLAVALPKYQEARDESEHLAADLAFNGMADPADVEEARRVAMIVTIVIEVADRARKAGWSFDQVKAMTTMAVEGVVTNAKMATAELANAEVKINETEGPQADA